VNVLDRVITWFAPQWGHHRVRARLAIRHFESASVGRRTDGYHRLATDANAAAGNALTTLRAQARDLVRNNPWARQGLRRLVANTVGWGIRPKAVGRGADVATQRWRDWAETTQCDAAGRLTMYGLQKLAMRTIVESGEVLIRRRWRLPEDGLAVPMQLQILEPDFLDAGRDGYLGEAGGPIVQGVEFDAIGRRVAYWLFDRHPGSTGPIGTGGKISAVSRRIPADGILHVYDQERAGQVRGPSWFASVDVLLHDFGDFQDATIVRQKIAAYLAAFVTDLDGTGNDALGQRGTDGQSGQATETFEPGMIVPLQPGKNVTFPNPPSTSDYEPFSAAALRGVAAGLGTTYEDLTGDLSEVIFSSGRMGRIAHQQDVHDWRWNMLIPQFCVPTWDWMITAIKLEQGIDVAATAEWHPAPMPLLDVDKESMAYQRRVRNGQLTWPQMVRELGEDPDRMLDEIEAFNKEVDRRGIRLDCDPRNLTVAGQAQQAGGAASKASAGKPNGAAAGADAAVEDSGDAADTTDTGESGAAH